MPAPAAYARRQFPGAAADTTIVSGINASDVAVTLASTSGWPDGAYTGGVLCELYSVTTGATAEKVWATERSTTTLTIVRAADGTSATSHAAATGIRPVMAAIDADEANKAVSEVLGKATTAGQMLFVSAAQTYTALAIGAAARIMVSTGSAPSWVAMSGDVTIDSSGVAAIGNAKVTSAMIAAAVAGAGLTGGAGSALAVGAGSGITVNANDVQIADSGVTNTMMADDAIDSAEIADGAIDLAHMSANSVDSDQYVDGSIDGVHIANDAIDSQHYADGSIDTAHLADSAVTSAKIVDTGLTLVKLHPDVLREFSWTPVVKLGGVSGTTVTIGNGAVSGYGMLMGALIFHYFVQLEIGSTTDLNGGTGQLVIGLSDSPDMALSYTVDYATVGVGEIRDASGAAAETIYARYEIGAGGYFTLRRTTFAAVTHAVPYALATGDSITFQGVARVEAE